jgi:hypothetical protein
MENIRRRSAGEDEFLQEVEEVYGGIVPFLNDSPDDGQYRPPSKSSQTITY